MTEALRIVAMLLGMFIVGMSGMVFYVYALKVKDRRRAVLGWHVVLISASYALWVSVAVADQFERLGESHVTFRLPVSLLAAVMGVAGLIAVLSSLERAGGAP